MYCAKCGNKTHNCVCDLKIKSFKSIAKSIEELKEGEYFYTQQPAKQVFAVVSRAGRKWEITTKKCLVIDPEFGDVLDTLTRVTKIKYDALED